MKGGKETCFDKDCHSIWFASVNGHEKPSLKASLRQNRGSQNDLDT